MFAAMKNKTGRRNRIVLSDFSLSAQFAIALGASGAISLIVVGLRSSFQDPPTFSFIYVPVIGATAYFVGRTAGLVVGLLSIVSARYFLFAPAYSFHLTPGNLLIMGLFTLVALLTALGPARLREFEREAEKGDQRLMLLAEASAVLGATLKHETSLTDVAHMMVPAFADWCVVELVEGNAIHFAAIVHADPAKVSMLEELHRSYPGARGLPGDYPQIIRNGRAELIPEILNSTREASAQDPRHLSLLGAVGTRTILRVPIRHDQQIDGVITFGRGNSGPRFDPADQVFAEDLGRRCGVALALGRAYEHQRAITETLQRNLLPQQLPDLPAAVVSARYLPAEAADIGGDWYDAIPLPDGHIGLAMGDVAGRGVEAAALMGQLRTALHVLALEGHSPSAVLQRVANLLQKLPLRQMVTLIYMVASPESMRIRFANAGHPPPLVVAPDGTTRYLVEGGTVPLGVGMPPTIGETEVPLPAKSTLVLYSDGLIERRGVGIEHGLSALEEVVRRGPISPEAVCTRLVQEMVGGAAMHDDVALLVVQFAPDTLDETFLGRSLIS